jgi:type I restriction enzyme S subunit
LYGRKIDPRFLYYCICSKDFTDQFYLSISGLIGGVTVSELKNLYVSVPDDSDTQIEIATYLDERIEKINELLDNQFKQIDALSRYKRAIITEAVTKGIHTPSEMKYSGYEWIGMIPNHWDMQRKLSYNAKEPISYGIVKLFEPDENGVRVIRCSDVIEGSIRPESIRTVSKEVSDEYSRTILTGGEVLVNVRGTLGGCAVVPNSMKGYNIAREVARISLNGALHNRYLMYYLLSSSFIDYRTRYLSGSVYVGLNIELLSSCPLPMPPLQEQVAISAYLDDKCQKVDELISIKQMKIEKLNQFKKTIIYEYVTGKKEVV